MDSVEEGVIELGIDGAFDLSALDENTVPDTLFSGKVTLIDHVQPPPPKEPWLEAKEAGNEAYAAGELEVAMKEYTKALSSGGEVDDNAWERAKIKSNRGLAGIKLGIGGRDAIVPSSFSIRDLSRNKWLCEDDQRRSEALKSAVDDCESALIDLQGCGGGKVVESQVVKTLHRKVQALGLMGKWEKAMVESKKANESLNKVMAMSLKQGVQGMLWSLKQLLKDIDALKEGLNCVAKMVMRADKGDGERLGCSRAALSGSLACIQVGGSADAAIGLAAATAYNIGTTEKDGPTGGMEVHKTLSEICEAVAKTAHYHKLSPMSAAAAVFDVLEKRTVWETVKLARCGEVGGILEKEAKRGAGVAAAMVASLRTEHISQVKKVCVDGVVSVGGTKEQGEDIAKMFLEDDGEGGDVDENGLVESLETFKGKREGQVFKLGKDGLGYYKDYGGPKRGTRKSKKIEEERLLDPDHPAFAKMTASQVSALEQMLKLTDEEVASLPNEQSPMILEFRKMYKENPMIFKKPKAPAAGASDSKKKENAKDPLKPFKDHAESLDWFSAKHGSFDRDKFLSEESKRLQKAEEERGREEKDRTERVRREAEGMGLGGQRKGAGVVLKAKKKKRGKKNAGANAEKGKELEELMGWAKS